MKVGNSNEFSYYCPDRKVWEETGYFRDVGKKKPGHKNQGSIFRDIAILCLANKV